MSLSSRIPGSGKIAKASLAITLLTLLAGCHHRDLASNTPPPPPISTRRPPAQPISPPAPTAVTAPDQEFVSTHQPIHTETGLASWYGPPYHNRQGANGQIFDQNAMTAAHRTLPMGSLIVVTNQKTGQSATMRVTDRGPFVQGRLLDLSKASAKAVGVFLPGVAEVRIDVYQTPRPIEPGGRWCVQIGAFERERKAEHLRDQLLRSYSTAKVIDFQGPTGYWVRIRPEGDNKELAESIVRRLRPEEGDAYLVRLD